MYSIFESKPVSAPGEDVLRQQSASKGPICAKHGEGLMAITFSDRAAGTAGRRPIWSEIELQL
jgi:hypothetical protein